MNLGGETQGIVFDFNSKRWLISRTKGEVISRIAPGMCLQLDAAVKSEIFLSRVIENIVKLFSSTD